MLITGPVPEVVCRTDLKTFASFDFKPVALTALYRGLDKALAESGSISHASGGH
jgi:hypothetical protein